MQLTEMLSLIVKGFWETLYMTLGSTVVAYAIGLPLGLLLILTDPQGLRPMPVFNRVLGVVINLLRSVPFIILLVWVMPVTRAIMGTTIGSKATLSPLTIAAAPFIARMVESSAREVDRGVIEAALSMGASPSQVLLRVILPEAKPSLITGGVISMVTILGYSAMAATIGGTGLGQIAIVYGHQRSKPDVTWVCVLLLVIIVQIIQAVGTAVVHRTDKRVRQ